MYALVGTDVTMTTTNVYVPAEGLTGVNLNNVTITASPTGTALTVANTGTYLINVTIDGASNNSNTDIAENIYINGIASTNLLNTIKYTVANNNQSASISGLLSLTSGDIITLRFAGNPAPVTFVTQNINLSVVQIG